MDYEILKSFFQNNYINPTWIDCNYTWGWFDNETGHWTGAVGKVKKMIIKERGDMKKYISRNSYITQ